jgi:hypothetical protein
MKKLVCIAFYLSLSSVFADYSGTYADQELLHNIYPLIDQADCEKKYEFRSAIHSYIGDYYRRYPLHNIQFDEELQWFWENRVESRFEYMMYSLDYLILQNGVAWLEEHYPEKLHWMNSRIDEWKEYYWCQKLMLPYTWWKGPFIEWRRKQNLESLMD